jgi:hypothetical protein
MFSRYTAVLQIKYLPDSGPARELPSSMTSVFTEFWMLQQHKDSWPLYEIGVAGVQGGNSISPRRRMFGCTKGEASAFMLEGIFFLFARSKSTHHLTSFSRMRAYSAEM